MPDGFHEVETRLCKISIADTVSLELKGKGSKIDLTCNIPGIPLDDSNLAIKALRALPHIVPRIDAFQAKRNIAPDP